MGWLKRSINVAKRGYKGGQKRDKGDHIVIGKVKKGCRRPKGRHRRPYSDWEG